MENNIINVLKNNFNISIGNYDGINVFAYGENNSVIYPEDYARKRVVEIEKAKADLELKTKEALEKKGQWEEYSQLLDAFNKAKAEKLNRGEYGFLSEDVPFGKELNEIRNEVAEEDEDVAEARQKFWDVSFMSKDEFYGNVGGNPNRPKNFPKYAPQGVLKPEYTNYYEIMRFMPRWVISELIFKWKAERNINTLKLRSNGTYTNADKRTKDYDPVRDTDGVVEKEEKYRKIVASSLNSAFRYIIDYYSDERVEDTFEPDLNRLIALISGLVKEGEIKAWTVAYKIGPYFMNGSLDESDFVMFTNNEVDVEEFKKSYMSSLENLDKATKTGNLEKLIGDFAPLRLESQPVFESEIPKIYAYSANNKYHKEILEKLSPRLAERLFWSLPFSEKKKGNKLFIFSQYPEFRVLLNKAKAEFDNNKYAVKALLNTRNWEICTGNQLWDGFLQQHRTELRQRLDFGSAEALNIGVKAAAEKAQLPEEIIRYRAALKYYNDFIEKVCDVKTSQI